VVLVGIEVKQHPIVIRVTGKVVGGLYIKINVMLVAGYLGSYYIVTAGGVSVIGRAVSGKITMSDIANGVPVLQHDIIPIAKVTINGNSFSGAGGGRGVYTFEFSDIVNHLEIITVGVAVNHRFDVPAVLMIVLVDEHCIGMIAVRRCCKYRPFQKPARYPFVPAGNKDKLRIYRQGVLPLFCEIIAVVYGIGTGIF